MEKLVEIKGLKKYYSSGIVRKVCVKAVDGVSLDIMRGETLALVGESGCGKTTLGRSLMRLTKPTEGEIYYNGQNITGIGGERLRSLRKKMQIIFQFAEGSLNKRINCFNLLAEPFRIHGVLENGGIGQVKRLIEMVNLTPDLLIRFPHQLSGGQLQKICIARAIALNPEFIVADEPAASLDFSVQAQVLELLQKLQQECGISYLFITHNLQVVKLIADRVAVMYLGKLVEIGRTGNIFSCPAHPYTRALLSSIPSLDADITVKNSIFGELPDAINPPQGCRFHPRCPYAMNICHLEEPLMRETGSGHIVACHLFRE